jgi:MFS family permease
VTTAGVLPAYLVGVLWVQLRADLDVGPSLLGLLVATFFGTSAVSTLIAGTLVRRLGTVPVVRLSGLTAALTMLVVALAARDPAVLVAALVVAGWATASGSRRATTSSRSVSAGRQGLAYGLKQAAIPLSTVLAGVAVPLVAIPLGWRTAFGIGAVLALLVVLSVPGPRRLGSAGSSSPPSEAAVPPRWLLVAAQMSVGGLSYALLSTGAEALIAVVAGLVVVLGRHLLLRERPALVAAHRQRRAAARA